MFRSTMLFAPLIGLGVALGVSDPAEAEVRYRVHVLTTPDGLIQPRASGVNDLGTVVGWAMEKNVFVVRGLVWFDPQAEPTIITGFGDDACMAVAVNESNVVVGNTSEGLAAFRWTQGSDLVVLENFASCCGQGEAINDQGVIVGQSNIQNGANHAATWIDDEITDLGVLDGDCCASAHDISNTGIVAGESNLRPARWINGIPEDLGTFGGIGVALGVNDAGDAVGWSVDGTQFSKPFVARRGPLQPLPLLPDTSYGTARAINNDGLIVGECYGSPEHGATVWKDDVPIALNERMVDAPQNIVVTDVRDISDAGYIAANGILDGVTVSLRLDPVPPWDVVPDGVVSVADLLAVLSAWGGCPPDILCAADINDDGVVNVADLLAVLSNWGGR